RENIIERHFMKDKISKENKIKRTKIDKKVRKIWKKLKPLYMEYKLLQLTKARNDEKDQLIDIISKTEYKYVCYLKK
ncbi:hypothetical protein, partial [Acinetobacter baumannii]|uniref:hypothetical protein n=1 Tax=Acinetobacter baumannii TaxID=470 RepID=UPI003395987E